MRPLVVIALVTVLAGCRSAPGPVQEPDIASRVDTLLRETPLIDGHNDLGIHYMACRECPRGLEAYDISRKTSGHTDLPRWQAGRIGGQLLNAGWLEVEKDLAGTRKGFSFVRDMAARYPDRLTVARTAADVRTIHAAGRIAILLGLEDPERLGTTEDTIRELAAEGLRSNILAYAGPTNLADGHAGPAKFQGLSPLGSQMVRWMEQHGILVDLSHGSADTMRDVLDQATAPVIFSHSSAAALCDVSRNVPDDVLRRLPANGGVVMVSFVPEFTRKQFADWYDAGDAYWYQLLETHKGNRDAARPAMQAWERDHARPAVALSEVADHIEHIRKVAGIDHVGIGGDYDGIDYTVDGLEDVSTYPRLFVELARRGWSNADLKKLAGDNFLRALATADQRRATAPQATNHSCVVVSENGGPPQFWNGTAAECATRLSPASTYKIPHALIGLETGTVTATTVEKWDGVKRPDQPKWNLDHTVLSAMRPSVLWFFQRMAPRIGASRAHEWLQRFGYGNTDTSGPISEYWLNGRLRISPDEQLAFLTKFYSGTLPVKKEYVAQLTDAMQQAPGTVENARGVQKLDAAWSTAISLNSKTGATTIASGESVSWLVGQLTIDARKITFASAVWKDQGGVDALEAARLTIKTFVDRGVLKRFAH